MHFQLQLHRPMELTRNTPSTCKPSSLKFRFADGMLVCGHDSKLVRMSKVGAAPVRAASSGICKKPWRRKMLATPGSAGWMSLKCCARSFGGRRLFKTGMPCMDRRMGPSCALHRTWSRGPFMFFLPTGCSRTCTLHTHLVPCSCSLDEALKFDVPSHEVVQSVAGSEGTHVAASFGQ